MWLRYLAACLTGLILVTSAQPILADEKADPLRLVPAEVDLIVKVEHPHKLVESFYNLNVVQDFLKLDAVKEFYDSTNARRFNQLLQYFEKELGSGKYELLDQIAGNGIVFGVKLAKKPIVGFVIQGKDQKTVQKFVDLTLKLVEEETARQEKKVKIQRKKYHTLEGVQVGKEFFFTVAGSAILVSNKGEGLKALADMYLGRGGDSILRSERLAKARKMLPENSQVWGFLDFQLLHRIGETRDFFEAPQKQPGLNFTLFGPMIDLARRSPFVCGSFSHEGNRFLTTIRFPRGTKGMPPEVAAFFPKSASAGALPLLEPKNVISSVSYYLDLAELWKNRNLLPQDQLAGLESASKKSGRFLAGAKIGNLMKWSGSHQRIVVAQRTKSVYKEKKPQQDIPAFAFVHEIRDDSFYKSMDRIFRTTAIFGAAALNLKLVEKDIGDVHLVSYRFPEDRNVPNDKQNLRYNFSPTYFKIGNQFAVCSTLELAEDLVQELKEESSSSRKSEPVMFHSKFYASGLAVALKAIEEQLITQAVLSQALSPEDARKQVDTFIGMVRGLGSTQMETVYTRDNFRLNFTTQLGSKK